MTGLIVHEWISRHGGSENVLEAMARALPEDDIFCLWSDASERLQGRTIRESWLSKSPLRKAKAAALPFMAPTWRAVDLSPYDSVLVSSHAFAHHVGLRNVRAELPIHVYVHTPARYIWAAGLDARGMHPLARAMAPVFRILDKQAASEGPKFAANSDFVRRRIEETWGQPSDVIHPPVRIEQLQSVSDWSTKLSDDDAVIFGGLPDEFVLGASRFVSYKRLDRVIEVGNACQIPVVLAGSGPEEAFLRDKAASASVPVIFVQRPSDELLFALYQRAMLFVFPPIEDFGIMPVEAMALGTPVLVNPIGGAVESVQLLDGGEILPSGHRSDLQLAVEMALGKDMSNAVQNARLLSESAFMTKILRWKSGKTLVNESPKQGIYYDQD